MFHIIDTKTDQLIAEVPGSTILDERHLARVQSMLVDEARVNPLRFKSVLVLEDGSYAPIPSLQAATSGMVIEGKYVPGSYVDNRFVAAA